MIDSLVEVLAKCHLKHERSLENPWYPATRMCSTPNGRMHRRVGHRVEAKLLMPFIGHVTSRADQ
jgi:hypothetical protein